jgi:hypothetical protein
VFQDKDVARAFGTPAPPPTSSSSFLVLRLEARIELGLSFIEEGKQSLGIAEMEL